MLMKYEEELKVLLYVLFLNTYTHNIFSDTTLIMLERTMYLAIILLLVRDRFQIHQSVSKHSAKVRTVN